MASSGDPGAGEHLSPPPYLISNGTPEDLIAMSWGQLGYRPMDSLVLVGLVGSRCRAGLMVRLDLPAPDAESSRLDEVAHLLRRHAMDAVVGLLFSDSALDIPRPAIVAQFYRRMPTAGLDLVDAIGVTSRAFRSFLCRDATCCPPGGFPLTRVESSRAAASLALSGRIIAPSEASLVADVAPDPHAPSPQSVQAPGDDGLPSALRQRILAEWTNRLNADDAGSADQWTAALATRLADPRLRDALLLAIISPHPGDSAPVSSDAGVPSAHFDQPPDPHRIEIAHQLLAAAARQAAPGRRADALGSLAWLHWYAANGARARLLAGLGLDDQPGHRLSGLVMDLLRVAVPPPWAAPGARRGAGREQ